MSVAVVTGSTGLVGSETARFFAGQGYDIVGLDNDMRAVFFGEDAEPSERMVILLAPLGILPGAFLHDILERVRYSSLGANCSGGKVEDAVK